MKLAIIQNWDESFGYYDIEINTETNDNNINNVIILKKKIVVYNWNRDDDGIEQMFLIL